MTFSPRATAILQALFVTFLWSLSFVLIKIELENIPALTFAGLRYVFAFLFLLPLGLRSAEIRAQLRNLTRPERRRDLVLILVLGVVYYSVTQGAQFAALAQIPAVTFSLILNFTAVVIAVLGVIFLGENINMRQWFAAFLALVGAIIYFYPVQFPTQEILGMLIAFTAMMSNSVATVLGRFINRTNAYRALTVTLVSMGVGSVLLLIGGITTQGLPELSVRSWGVVIWLALVHTSLTFTLWNHTMRTLTAAESGIINNTMLIQIAVLGWVFLGEGITLQGAIGLVFAGVGSLMFQLWGKPASLRGSVRTARIHNTYTEKPLPDPNDEEIVINVKSE